MTNSLFHRIGVWWRGRCDGRKNRPDASAAESAFYETRLVNRGNQHLGQVARSYARLLERLEGQRNAQIDLFRKTVRDYTEEADHYDEIREKRHVQVFLGKTAFYVIFSAIVLGEAALNAQAFGIFHEVTVLTWIMAAAVVVTIPFVAHGVGIILRQWPSPKNWYWAASLFTFVVAVLLGINEVRVRYLVDEGIAKPEEASFLKWSFFLINMFVFVGAALVTFLAHDENKELEESAKRLAKLDRATEGLSDSISQSGGQLDGERHAMATELDEVKTVMKDLILLYRDVNYRNRPDGKRPQSFTNDPKFTEVQYDELQKAKEEQEVEQLRQYWQDRKNKLAGAPEAAGARRSGLQPAGPASAGSPPSGSPSEGSGSAAKEG